MIVLGIDIETTGLDPSVDEITEVAFCLYDLARKHEIFTFSSLVSGNKPIPEDVEKLTGISNEMRHFGGMDKDVIKPLLLQFSDRADYLVAHNAAFEKSFLGENLGSWIDTATDIPYPDRITTRKLTHLCAEHGVWIRGAHRALNDVRAMLELMTMYDYKEIERYALSPSVVVRADVSYDNREKAKARGYRWDVEKKIWVKPLKQFQVEEERAGAGFPVLVVSGC